jgi:hypothetical protein
MELTAIATPSTPAPAAAHCYYNTATGRFQDTQVTTTIVPTRIPSPSPTTLSVAEREYQVAKQDLKEQQAILDDIKVQMDEAIHTPGITQGSAEYQFTVWQYKINKQKLIVDNATTRVNELAKATGH